MVVSVNGYGLVDVLGGRKSADGIDGGVIVDAEIGVGEIEEAEPGQVWFASASASSSSNVRRFWAR